MKTKGRTREGGSLQNPDSSLNIHMDLLGVRSLGGIKLQQMYKLFLYLIYNNISSLQLFAIG